MKSYPGTIGYLVVPNKFLTAFTSQSHIPQYNTFTCTSFSAKALFFQPLPNQNDCVWEKLINGEKWIDIYIPSMEFEGREKPR